MKPLKKTRKHAPLVNEPSVSFRSASSYDVESLLSIAASKLDEPLDRVSAFRKGFSKKSFLHLKEATGLDYQTMALALAVSTKTLQRTEVFDTVQSEKMYELAELYSVGMSYFGEEGFKRWMERPLFTLGNRRPIELLDVSEGIELLRTEIVRLQHGVAV